MSYFIVPLVSNFNNLLTRDVLIRFLLPELIDQRCFNIHLRNKLLTTGVSFCKNPPSNNVLSINLFIWLYQILVVAHEIFSLCCHMWDPVP